MGADASDDSERRNMGELTLCVQMVVRVVLVWEKEARSRQYKGMRLSDSALLMVTDFQNVGTGLPNPDCVDRIDAWIRLLGGLHLAWQLTGSSK